MGKASIRQTGLRAAIIPRRFLNCDSLGRCTQRNMPIAVWWARYACFISLTSGCGSESPAHWPAIEANRMDRLRFAHPTS